MKAKIDINGRFLGRQLTGVDRFAIELLEAMGQQTKSFAWTAVMPSKAETVTQLHNLQIRQAGRLNGHAWEQLELPRLAGDAPLLNLCNTAPAFRENQLVVIHDAAAAANPANYSWAFRSWYNVLLRQLMAHSRMIVTVSQFSADELRRYFGPRPKRLEVIGEGGEQILRTPPDNRIIDRLSLKGRPFILALGSHSPNKNFKAIAQAMALLPDEYVLVSAGGANSKVFAATAQQAARQISTGYVTDAELRALYEHAACFVFPSFYEGFGLPPLEAMNCGCPVIVSNRASLPEVCGKAALYCNPDDPTTIAHQMKRLLESRTLREEMAEAGRVRAAHYSWARAAADMNAILRSTFQA